MGHGQGQVLIDEGAPPFTNQSPNIPQNRLIHRKDCQSVLGGKGHFNIKFQTITILQTVPDLIIMEPIGAVGAVQVFYFQEKLICRSIWKIFPA